MLHTRLFLLILILIAVVTAHRIPFLESVDQQEAEAEAALERVEDDGVDLGALERFRQPQPSGTVEHKPSGGCSGGCSGTRGGAQRRSSPPGEYQEERPRPIYGLLSNIIESARMGYRLDFPRAHLLY